jgi:hypothetical protein
VTAFGLVRLERPFRAPWPAQGLPPAVYLGGVRFVRSTGIGRPGVVAHYRQDVPRDCAHAYVMDDGTYMIDHVDRWNPHPHFLRHLIADVLP